MKVIRNMSVLNLGSFIFFSAYQGLINLQSTINAQENLGIFALFVKYSFSAFSALLLTTLLIEKLGCKSVLVFGCIGYIPYAAANFYPLWEIFIPSAALGGVAAALLMSARATCTYDLIIDYAFNSRRNQDVTSALFFGINCMSWSLAFVFGNFISFLVLRPLEDQEQTKNASICGSSFRQDLNISNSNLEPLPDEKRYILIAVYIACMAVAASMFQFGLNLPQRNGLLTSKKPTFSLLLASMKLLRNKAQILLLPLSLHISMSSGFFFAGYTKAYIGCAIGMHEIGRVMAAYGLTCALTSPFLGKLTNHIGYLGAVSSSAVMNFCALVALLVWEPTNDSYWPYYIIAIVFGYVDAILWALFPAYYGIVFSEEKGTAISNFYVLIAVGFLSSFALQGTLSVDVVIYILICTLCLGMIGFYLVEINFRRISRKATKCTEHPPLNPEETKNLTTTTMSLNTL